MLWPLIQTLQVSLLILAVGVALATTLAPKFNWKRRRAFVVATVLACLAFLPVVIATGTILDKLRFGVFQYETFAEVNDVRIERYLPPKARQITVDKFAQGHRAKYTISESDLMAFLDGLWTKYGSRSAMSR